MAWIPGDDNISDDVAKYSPSLAVYAGSLAETFGQKKVPFFCAHPTDSLVDGITTPRIAGASITEFDQWPKSLEAIAKQLVKQASSYLSLQNAKPPASNGK